MLKVDSTIEDLEKSLSIPSFEEELKLSDLPHKIDTSEDKGGQYVKCKVCGKVTFTEFLHHFQCPNEPHDVEDEPMSGNDIRDVADEDLLEIED